MAGLHLVGPIGPHLDNIRIAYAHGMRLFVHVKPEPGDGPLLRGATGSDAILCARWAGEPGSGLSDQEIQALYEANPLQAAQHLWSTFYGPLLSAAGMSSYNILIWNNEPGLGNGAERAFRIEKLLQFSRAARGISQAHGLGMGYFAWSMGVPEPHEWPLLYDFMRECMALNEGLPEYQWHRMSLHQYGSWGVTGPGSLLHDKAWYALRFELTIWPTLPPELKGIPYFIGEAGPDHPGGITIAYGDQWPALVVDIMSFHNQLVLARTNCAGWAFFTVHQEGGFGSFDIRHHPFLHHLITQNYAPLGQEVPPMPEPGYEEVWSTHHSDRLGHRPKFIVLHTTEGNEGTTMDDTVDFLTENTRLVSTHWLMGEGRIIRMVRDERAAHTSESPTSQLPDGSPPWQTNERTLNLEMFRNVNTTVLNVDLRNSIFAARDWCVLHNLPVAAIISHRQIDPSRRNDPVGVDMLAFREAVARLLREDVIPDNIMAATKAAQKMSYNGDSALTKYAFGIGYTLQLSDEVRSPREGRVYITQLWGKYNPTTKQVTEAVMGVYDGDWSNCEHEEL